MKNWSYTITEGPHKGETLWSGRYCAVVSLIFCCLDGRWSVLANRRGSGTPDFQGYWNCPCGFLEADESGKEGCAREIKEETGLEINPGILNLDSVETDPKTCNKGHVTLRYWGNINKEDLDPNYNIENPENIKNLQGGEVNEVSAIKWIPIDEIDDYQWAFNHKDIIKQVFYNNLF